MATLFTRIHDLVKQKGLTNLYLLFRRTKFQILIRYFVTKCMHDMYNNTAPPLNSTTPRKPALICTGFTSNLKDELTAKAQRSSFKFMCQASKLAIRINSRVGQVLHVGAGCIFFISDAGIKMVTMPQKLTIFFL